MSTHESVIDFQKTLKLLLLPPLYVLTFRFRVVRLLTSLLVAEDEIARLLDLSSLGVFTSSAALALGDVVDDD